MSKAQYYSPQHAVGQFHCPTCNVYAKQRWTHLNGVGDTYTERGGMGVRVKSNIFGLTTTSGMLPQTWTMSTCDHCGQLAIWNESKLMFPKNIQVSQPNLDLDPEIQKDYLEAASIHVDSPRAAAALLRLALQRLCMQLGGKGININDDIGALVGRGLNPVMQQSLDSLRITGNNAVHPGHIDLSEDPSVVVRLFELINFIAEKMITEPKEIGNFYERLPEQAKLAIKERDESKSVSGGVR